MKTWEKLVASLLTAAPLAVLGWVAVEAIHTWRLAHQNSREIEHIKEHVRELEANEHDHTGTHTHD